MVENIENFRTEVHFFPKGRGYRNFFVGSKFSGFKRRYHDFSAFCSLGIALKITLVSAEC